MLLVTGPVSRNMELALRRTYDATPAPKLVVAVGDCGCTGGIFGESYASCGRVANVIPVDVDGARLPAAAAGDHARHPGRGAAPSRLGVQPRLTPRRPARTPWSTCTPSARGCSTA